MYDDDEDIPLIINSTFSKEEKKEIEKKEEITFFQKIKFNLFNSNNETLNNICEKITNNKLNILFYIISIFFYFKSINLYYKSLDGCFEPQTKCLITVGLKFFKQLAFLLFKSSLYFSIYLFLSINNYINRFFLIGSLIYIPIFYKYSGGDLGDHGSYNRLAFIFLVFFLLSILEILYLYIYFIFEKKYKITIIMTLTFILLSSLILYKKKHGCDNWEIGLGKIKIESMEESKKNNLCYIQKPKTCWINPLDNLFDINKWTHKSCKQDGKERKRLLKYLINDNAKKSLNLAYPTTDYFDFKLHSRFKYFNYGTLMLIYSSNSTKEEEKDDINQREVFVNFNENGTGKVEINLKKKENVLLQRIILSKLYPNVKFETILILYTDAISRVHFFRKFKETSKILEQLYWRNNNILNHKFKSYQFLKYQNFDSFTQINIMPMFYGSSMKSLNGINILKYLKNLGYITGGSENICSRELFDLEDYYTNNTQFESFDHENFALFCDPNMNHPEDPYTPFYGPYSYFRRCLYNYDSFHYVFEYGKQFLNTYENNRKYLRLAFIDGHEGTNEVSKYLDNELSDFLYFFLEKFMNEKTAILIMSDHGGNMISIHDAIGSEDYKFEKTLGLFFLILYDSDLFNKTALEINEQRLITPYDIHDTLIDMMNVNMYKSDFGQSVFNEIDGMKRNCQSYDDWFHFDSCRCINFNQSF